MGVREILIQRRRHHQPVVQSALLDLGGKRDRWGGPALLVRWPFREILFGEPRLLGLLFICWATHCFTNPLAAVFMAVLQSRMRFRAGALTGLFNTTLLVLLSVIFAWKGYGREHPPAASDHQSRAADRFLVADASHAGLRPQFAGGNLCFATTRCSRSPASARPLSIRGIISSSASFAARWRSAPISSRSISPCRPCGCSATTSTACYSLPQQDFRQSGATAGRIHPASQLFAVIGVPVCVIQAITGGPLVHALFSATWAPRSLCCRS